MKRLVCFLFIVSAALICCNKEEGNPNWQPSVFFLDPENDVAIETGDSLNIEVYAYDKDGLIEKVIFYLDNQVIHTDEVAPYQYQMVFLEEGIHQIKAKAIDNQGADSVAGPLLVFVAGQSLPYVTLNYSPNININEHDRVTFNIEVSDENENIVNTSLYVDGELFEEDNEYPFTIIWDSIPMGNYIVYATAETGEGEIGQSSAYMIEVIENQPPAIEIIYPSANNDTIMPRNWIHIEIHSEDADGFVIKDEIYANGNLIATLIDETSFDWPPQPGGQYILQARSYDNKGGVGYSQEVEITVIPGIFIDGVISDLTFSEDDELVFGLDQTYSRLLMINPLSASLSDSVTLPFPQPIAMDYSLSLKKLYIVYKFTGEITVYDKTTQQLTSIFFSSASDGRDIKIDELHRRIYVRSNSGLHILDLDNETMILDNMPVNGGSLAIDYDNQLLFTADEDLSPAKIYKYSLAGDALTFLGQKSNCGDNPRKLEINPNGDYVVLPSGGGNGYGYTVFAFDTQDLNNILGEFDIGTYPQYACFTPDGGIMLGTNGNSYDENIYIMNAGTFIQMDILPLPNASNYARMTTNASGTKIIAFSYDDFNEEEFTIYIYDL